MDEKKINKMQIFIWGISLVPVLMAALTYGKLPDQIPTNWGMNGAVSYGAKSNIWIIAAMAPFFGVLFFFLPQIDPKRRNYNQFQGVYQVFQLMMQILLLVVTGIIIIESLAPGTIDVTTVVLAMCGLLFAGLGIIMPKFKQNFFCGIKTPWTLVNEVVWTRTHKLGGKLMFAAGIIGFLGAFLPDDNWKIAALLVPLVIATLVPCVMSFIWYNKNA